MELLRRVNEGEVGCCKGRDTAAFVASVPVVDVVAKEESTSSTSMALT